MYFNYGDQSEVAGKYRRIKDFVTGRLIVISVKYNSIWSFILDA
eukprot:UN15698